MPLNLPNLLTLFRLLAAPALAFLYVIFASPLADALALCLFVLAAITDFFDGYLARRWDQISAFGRMADPIADKAMVMIALALLIGLWQGDWLVLIPAVLIIFREVAVSGLREFLGSAGDRVRVTQLAKWKTTLQMVAIACLIAAGIPEAQLGAIYYSTDPATYEAILDGRVADEVGLRFWASADTGLTLAGLALLWLAAMLTLATGADYFIKAWPYLREEGS